MKLKLSFPNPNITPSEFAKRTLELQQTVTERIYSETKKTIDYKSAMKGLSELSEDAWDKYADFINESIDHFIGSEKHFDKKGIPLTSETFHEYFNDEFITLWSTSAMLILNEMRWECQKLKNKLRTEHDRHLNEDKDEQLKEEVIQATKEAFIKLFRFRPNADKVIKILFENKYIDKSEQWLGSSGKKNELLNAFLVLKGKGLLINGPHLPKVKLFYDRFGLTYGVKGKYATIGTLRTFPVNSDTDNFRLIFAAL